jgi:hypothetical protein
VFSALQMGARIVWLPTIHSHQDYLKGKAELLGIKGEGIRVIDEAGAPALEVREIFAMVRILARSSARNWQILARRSS